MDNTMADIDLKPLFKFPETTDTLISFLEVVKTSLRTAQHEPYRHFMQVRLLEKTDRVHLLSTVTKWQTLLRMGQGQVERGTHDLAGQMPAGYVPSKFKGKTVLREVIEPTKPFTDKELTPVRTKLVPSKMVKKRIPQDLSLESFSFPAQYRVDMGSIFSQSQILFVAGLEELAYSDDGLANHPSGVNIPDGKGGKKDLSYFELIQKISQDTDIQDRITDDGDRSRVSVGTESLFLPFLVGQLIKALPKVIKTLSEPKYADKYPKLLKALKSLQLVLDVIQSDK
jgi:hypothetical protein